MNKIENYKTETLRKEQGRGWEYAGNYYATLHEAQTAVDDDQAAKPTMTYSQRYASLELTDKLYQFAEQYQLGDDWVYEMAQTAKAAAFRSTGIDTDEA